MAEMLFILTTIFVAYVVFVVVDCERKQKEAKKAAKPEASKPAAAVKTAAAVKPKAAAPKKPVPAKKAPAKAATASDSLKNPETGEVVKVPNNYRFTKRWIKEALVTEGLLEKIYKNNELDDAITAKISDALGQLKAMKKYQ